MKPSSTRRSRRRPARDAAAPQQDQKQDRKFFGPVPQETFFQPAIHRAPEAQGEEKKEEKVSRAPEEEKKEEGSVQAAAMEPEEKRKEEKVDRAPAPEEKKEEKVARKGEPGAAGPKTARYVQAIGGKGQPLSSTDRAYFGNRLGYDFGAVRIHTGKEAAESARDAGAKAYTYGRHIVFNEGRYDTGSHEGRKLMAHELAHVVQQDAPEQVHRQQGDRTGTVAQAPAATDRAVFNTRLSMALSQMVTPTVAAETLGGTLEPVLRDMGANAEWVDAAGTSSGGAHVSIALPRGGRTVRLRLVLDDAANPSLQGRFDSTGADTGAIRIFVRQNGDADILATTLYHESLHMMRWLARHSPGGDFQAETGATGGRRATLEGIDPARQPRHVAMVRRHVADLASSVNAARPSTDQVDASGIDRLTNFMMEEYLTRIETEVFRLMRDSDAASRRIGVATVRIGTSPDTFFPRGDVDKYLFEIASIFRAADRASLSAFDRGRIDNLYEYFRDRVDMFVRRRYSEVLHGPTFP